MQETRRRGEELEPTDTWWVMQEGSGRGRVPCGSAYMQGGLCEPGGVGL